MVWVLAVDGETETVRERVKERQDRAQTADRSGVAPLALVSWRLIANTRGGRWMHRQTSSATTSPAMLAQPGRMSARTVSGSALIAVAGDHRT